MLIDSENLIARIDKCYQESAKTGLWLEPVMAIRDIKALISVMPTVDDVPLDKLCEWLERNAAGRWNGLEYTAAGWKDELTRWMEEQDAAD